MKNSEKNAKQLKIVAKINNVFPKKNFKQRACKFKMNNGAKLLGAGAPAVFLVS